MIKREDDGVWVEQQVSIACHHEEVFACLTTAVGLSRWFPVAAKIDLRTGGKIVLGWDEKFTRTTTIAILDYDAGGWIVWDWFAANEDIHAPVYWNIQPDVEKGSVIHFRQGPFHDTTESLIAMAAEAQYWCWQLCNLRGVMEAQHDMRKVRPL